MYIWAMTSSSSKRTAPVVFRRRGWPVIPLYVFRVIALPALAVGGVLFFALSLERLLRLIQVVTEQGAPPGEALALIVFLFPHYLEMALPAGFFFGVMLGIRHLHERSELLVMRSFGISAARLLWPIEAFALFLVLVLLAITSWAQPNARYLFREHMAEIVSREPLKSLTPGSLLSLGPDNLVMAHAVLERGRSFKGFFLSRQNEDGTRDYLTAESAEVMEPETTGTGRTFGLKLSNGTWLCEKKDGGAIPLHREVHFGSMVTSISLDEVFEEVGPRGSDERELTLGELFAGRAAPDLPPAKIRAELHRRVVTILALPVLGILALPLALMGRGRSARASGFGVGLLALLIFEKTARLGQVVAEEGRISPWIGVWIPLAGLLVFAMWAYWRFSGDLAKPPRRRKQPRPGYPCREALAEGVGK